MPSTPKFVANFTIESGPAISRGNLSRSSVDVEICFAIRAHRAPVRCVAFAKGDRKFLAVTDPFTKLASSIYIYKLDPERPAKRTVAA